MSALDRTEWLALAAALAVLSLAHWQEMAWARFAAAFLAIDLVGYLPGALAFRRARGQAIAPVYHWLYNATHNFVTGTLVIAGWAQATGRLEWAMLAIPLHLAGDRGVFGNGFKTPRESFERRPVAS
jgi:hypothetical protein